MKRIYLLILIFTFILCGCATDKEQMPPVTTATPHMVIETTEELPPEPVDFSPLAKEHFLEPIEDYSWEREFAPEYVMLHFTSAVVISRDDPYNMETVRKIFEDIGLSIHYVIDRDGNIYCYMPETRAAWHAGKGTFADDERLTNAMNKYSIGIEMLAIGSESDMSQYLEGEEYALLDDSFVGFTDAQYESLSVLAKDICERNVISFDREHVIGHDEYNPQKSDPGELFDWDRLFEPDKTVYVAESLDEWANINYDGFFAEGGSCYRFINGLVHHNDSTSVDDDFTEFLTVRISDYQISRVDGEKTLHFDFTVAESGLAKLPVGTYETELYPDNGPFAPDDARFEIVSTDANIPYGDFSDYNDVIEYLSAFILAERSWDVGDYKNYGKESAAEFPENYLSYIGEGKYTLDEFIAFAYDKLGIKFTAEDRYIKDNLDADGNISLMGGYGGFACRYDVVDFVKEWNKNRITLQFYADSNGLIESVRVEYTVGNEGEIYGCELLRTSDYEPFGSVYPTYKYKGWEPSYKSDYSDYYFDRNYGGYASLDAKEVTADEFAALKGSYPVYTYKYPAYHGGLLYDADDATLEDSEEKEIFEGFTAVDTSKIISEISSHYDGGVGVLKYEVFYSTVDYFGYSLPCYKIYVPQGKDIVDIYFYRAMVMSK